VPTVMLEIGGGGGGSRECSVVVSSILSGTEVLSE
jgi:hypothetical protein